MVKGYQNDNSFFPFDTACSSIIQESECEFQNSGTVFVDADFCRLVGKETDHLLLTGKQVRSTSLSHFRRKANWRCSLNRQPPTLAYIRSKNRPRAMAFSSRQRVSIRW